MSNSERGCHTCLQWQRMRKHVPPGCAEERVDGVGWICAACEADAEQNHMTQIGKLGNGSSKEYNTTPQGGDPDEQGADGAPTSKREALHLREELTLLEEEDHILKLRQQLLQRRRELLSRSAAERADLSWTANVPEACSTQACQKPQVSNNTLLDVPGFNSKKSSYPWMLSTGGERDTVVMSGRPAARISAEQLAARKTNVADLVKFSGKPEDWPMFLATYEQSTELCGFSDAENLMRLRHALEGPAKLAVRSLMLHADCVPQILSTLEMRFGRPEIIIDLLLKQIKQFPSVRENKLENIVDFAMEVQNVCATMKASKLEQYLNNPALTQELVSKLPCILQTFWGMPKMTLRVCTLADFSAWLSQMAQGANSVMVPSSQGRSERRGVVNTHVVRKACKVCLKNCGSVQECRKFLEMTTSDRWKMTRRLGLCWRCFSNHTVQSCGMAGTCGLEGCQQKHHPLLHRESREGVQANCNAHRQDAAAAVLFRVVPVTLYSNGNQVNTHAFLDDGSSLTLIDEPLLAALGVKGQRQPLCMQWTAGMHRYEDESVRVDLQISGAGMTKVYNLRDVHSVKALDLPAQTLDVDHLKNKYKHLRHLPLGGYAGAQPRLLIGLNNCGLGRALRTREGSLEEPIAEKTRLGWTVKGGGTTSSTDAEIRRYHVFQICACEEDNNKEILRLLRQHLWSEQEVGYGAECKSQSDDDLLAVRQLEANTMRVEGRFETSLLWRHKDSDLPDSLPTALKRAHCLNQKLLRQPDLASEVRRQLDEYVRKGYARPISPTEAVESPYWYLPIFPVVNVNKPGKLRIVWDAAARSEGISLNSLLLKGPAQLAPLVPILRRYRERRVAIGGDIAEMFHQVRIRAEDQRYQRFIFIDPETQKRENYVMQVMTFGASCSPSCAQFVKNRNASEFEKQYPRAVKCILENHYVDDMLDSVDTEEEAINLARTVHHIHSQAGFHIRNWVSNSRTVLEALGQEKGAMVQLDENADKGTEKVLGMWWDTKEDMIRYRVSPRYKQGEVLQGKRRPTKREFLSMMMSIYDPLGLISFFVMYAKTMFQEIWRSGCQWDDPILEAEWIKWKRWIHHIPNIEELCIPRCYMPKQLRGHQVEMHTFVDASESGFAAVCYLRIKFGPAIHCCLLGSKAKVAPLRLVSIPRLELMGATLGARLAYEVEKSLTMQICKRIFWTDSRTVLSWLRSDQRKYKQFVAFRVSEILDTTKQEDWRWVPTSQNVADEATKWTRTPDFSSGSRWLNGPKFLWQESEGWPTESAQKTDETDAELKVQFIGVCAWNESISHAQLIDPLRFSSWTRLLRSMAKVIWSLRRWKSKGLTAKQVEDSTTQEDLLMAESILWSDAQAEHYQDELALLRMGRPLTRKSSLYKLGPYLDGNGVLRLQERTKMGSGKDRVVLPSSSPITQLIIAELHAKLLHANHETLINELRQSFWIPKLRPTVARLRRSCQICKNRQAAPRPPRMADLPYPRLAAFHRPFSYTGVDYFGPLLVTVRRSSEKRYGVLFTCLSTRAIHLEVAYSLTADSCILAVRNFIARRGRPVELWSDNGTNFQGASTELRRALDVLDKVQLEREFTGPEMKWKFIPPASPHMGGAWERLVRSVKVALYSILSSARPSDELLRGALMEVEMIVNSRPLTYIPVKDENEEALTPNHFLLGSSSGSKPATEPTVEGMLLKRSWMASQQLADMFWKRWLLEYLPVITRRGKWCHDSKPLEAGDIVYVCDPGNPRSSWPKGRILSVKLSADGQVRSATVKTISGVYVRPATKLAVLSIESNGVESSRNIPAGSVAIDYKN
nr:uncharacterized protein LOC123002519 [Drosophila takahashii]